MSLSVLSRRGALAGAAALAALPAWAKRATPEPDDMAIGSPKARVTVVEYASAGCPHCAEWANDVFPAFKAKFIDTGKVRFILRECITGDPDLAMAGFQIARCAGGPAKYFQVLEGVFKRQKEIFAAGGGNTILYEIGGSVGMDKAAVDACIASQEGFAAVQARSDRHANVDKVSSTPTFDVNGKVTEGFISLADLGAAVVAARRKA
jgi:protein-disulfide isomerase